MYISKITFMKVKAMEIQDRNNIMQLALNLNFDNKSLSVSEEMGFIDMIKKVAAPQDQTLPEMTKRKDSDFSKATDQVSSNLVKKSSDSNKEEKLAVSDNNKLKNTSKTDNLSEKKPIKQSETYKDTAKEENTVAYTSEQSVNQNNIQSTDNNSSVEDEAVIAYDDNIVENNIPVNIIMPLPAMEITEESVSSDILPQTAKVNDLNNEYNVTPSDTLAVKNISYDREIYSEDNTDIKITDEKNTADNIRNDFFELTTDDEVLIEQTKFLDHKLSPSRPIKIDVSVNEEKIAAPIENNILQNSFEITSMLQHTDFDEQTSPDKVVVLEKQDSSVAQQETNNILQPYFAENELYNAEIQKSSASIEDVAVNSVRGIDLSPQSVNRNQFFSKVQELNDNSLKGLSKEVVEQIKVNITKSAVKGVDTIDIQLKPQDLGKVQIRMFVSKDGHLHADIISSRQETSDLLQREVENLSKSFQEAGYDTDKQSFNFSFQRENQTNQQDEQQLKQFIGKALEQDDVSQANDNQIYDPALGLNIRV